MRKHASVLIESLILFFVILCFFLVALPFVMRRSEKEQDIVKWSQKFSNIEYAYSILMAQCEDENINLMSSISQNKLKQFLREKRTVGLSYKPQFKNKKLSNEIYTFDKFYENENGIVLGFKWINPKCTNREICAVMSVDINGEKGPNIWGKDIFGVNFYRDSVEPIGKEFSLNEMKKDCSKQGTGLACSAYYLVGGLIVK